MITITDGVNTLIALASLVTTAVLCALLAGNFTGNWSESFLGVLAYVGILMNGDLRTLYQYLVKKPSPLPRGGGQQKPLPKAVLST